MHTAKVNELLNMDKIWCGGGGRQTAIATGSLDTLGSKTETGRIIQSETCGTRICTNGQFRCRFPCKNAKAHDFARTSHNSCTSRKPSCFSEIVTVHFINHRCHVNQNQCVEPAPEAVAGSSKVWFCKKAIERLKISPQDWSIHSTQKINDMSHNQLISDPLT